MDFVSRFNTDIWCPGEAQDYGFVHYTVVRPQLVEPGVFKYAVRQVKADHGEGVPTILTLGGACGKMNPLANIRNAELLTKEGAIVGINIDGQCVVRKDLI